MEVYPPTTMELLFTHPLLWDYGTTGMAAHSHYKEREGEDNVVQVHQLRGAAAGADEVPG